MVAPRNPSELQRLETEIECLKDELKEHYPKKQKEEILRQIREIERILGYDHQPYNK